MMKKISFISAPGLENFMIPIAKGLEKRGYGVRAVSEPDDKKIVDAVLWSDIVWLEWGNELTMRLTTDAGLLNQRNVILRIHSYEAFLPYIRYINYERIDCLIFVAEHIKDLVLLQLPKIEKIVKDIQVIPNGVDLDAIPFQERQPGNNLAYIGYINFKKGPMLLMQAFAHLSKLNPDLQLHIAGTFQESRYELYFKQFLDHAGLKDKATFYGHVKNISKWLEDKNYIISTSVLESQGMGIMEAMAAGVKPLIHNFYGADIVYDSKDLWTTFDELTTNYNRSYKSDKYRSFISTYYSLSNNLDAIESVIEDLPSKLQIKTGMDKVAEADPVTLSVCMMVRDESKNLDRCLSAIKDFADEIIVVDTGSVDNSIAVCKKYGAIIHKHPWENFSVHRNQSIGYATKEWIMIYDADEEFVGSGVDLKKAIGAAQGSCDAMGIVAHDLNEDGSWSVNSNLTKFFRNGTVHFEGTVHNDAMFDRGKVAFFIDAYINHYGYHGDPELKKKKSARTIGLLEKELVDNPSRTKVLFYLFQSYADIGEIDKALDYGWKYLAKRNEAHDFNDSIFFGMISVYLAKQDYNNAKRLLDEALLIIPNDIDVATAMIELGIGLNDGSMMIEGVNKYVLAYNFMIQNPATTGIRFTFSFRPDSLAYVLHRAAMCHFENATRFVAELKKSVEKLEPKTRESVLREFDKNLRVLGLTINDKEK